VSADLDQRLRESLHRGADALPYAPDLTHGAMARGRAIRRRRRTAAGFGVAAVVAVAVPVGLQLGGDVTGTQAPVVTRPSEPVGPPSTTLDVGALPRGDTPRTPWAEGETYHGGGVTLDLQGPVGDVFRTDAGAYVVDDPIGPGEGRLVTAAGDVQRLYGAVDRLTQVVSSPDGRWTALLYEIGDPQTTRPTGRFGLSVFDATARSVVFQQEVGESYPWLAAVTDDGRVLVQPTDGRALVYSDGDLEPADVTGATAWSPEAGLYAVTTRLTESEHCTAVRTQAGPRLWETCDWSVTGFSPDGRWAYGMPPIPAGYGQDRVAVLDARTGEVVRRVTVGSGSTDAGIIRDHTFESGDTLLLQVEAGDQAALVRLDIVTGEAELATEPVTVRPIRGDTPYALG